MSKYLFLYKENGTNDRDAIKYIEVDRLDKLECGHYFPGIRICGACFSQELKLNEIDFDNITSILNKDEFIKLVEYDKNINSLGYGLDKQPEKQEQAHLFFKDIENIIEKLKSVANMDLFDQVQQDEKKFIYNEYNTTPDEAQKIFDAYTLDYKDRAIIGAIYSDFYELGEDTFELYDHKTPDFIRDCINFEELGEKVANDEFYYILDDGRIVYLNY